MCRHFIEPFNWFGEIIFIEPFNWFGEIIFIKKYKN